MNVSLFFDLHGWLAGAMICFARLAPVFFMLPFLNSRVLTGAPRNAVIVLVGMALWPYTAGTLPRLDSLGFYGLLLREAGVGVILGCLLSWPFWVLHAMGNLIDNQRGAMLSSTVDPANGDDTSELANFLQLFAAVIYLEGGGMGGDRASTYYHYAWHQWCSGQPEQALQSIEISLAEAPASVAAQLLRARIALSLDPRRGLTAIRSAIDVLGIGHEGVDAMYALILDVCGDSMAALEVVERAGLSQVQSGEVGLVACYVLAAFDPLEARRHYERWRAASNYPPVCPLQLPVLRRLEGDFYAAPLWSERERKACPRLLTQLGGSCPGKWCNASWLWPLSLPVG